MLRTFILILLILIIMPSAAWSRVEEIKGTAKAGGHIVYVEKHQVEYSDDGKLLRAETHYESPEGKRLALLKSDFTTSLTVPDHVVEDFRSGDIEGLRRENGKLVLFDQEKNKSEKTRVLEENDADKRILVGCQGLNYYLLGHLDGEEPVKALPLRFLIPGKLDYYDFDMKEIPSGDKKVAEFEISIKNWFLRMFAPKLYAKYDRKTKHLGWYNGLSNIKNDKGENQSVVIEYEYIEKDKNGAL
jgi:hypothetical protein